jgi:hypothetical protein
VLHKDVKNRHACWHCGQPLPHDLSELAEAAQDVLDYPGDDDTKRRFNNLPYDALGQTDDACLCDVDAMQLALET